MNLEALDMVRSVEAVDNDVLRVTVKPGSGFHFEGLVALHSSYRMVDHSVTTGTYWITDNNNHRNAER